VREALQRLAAEGIVDLHRNRGAAIRSLSLQETLDVLEVAELMTGLLARTAARAFDQSRHRKMLQAVLDDLARANRDGGPSVFSAARRHFYRALLDVGANQELRRLFPAIHMPIVHAQFRLPDLQKLRFADYKKIGAAVLMGDCTTAEVAGMNHVRRVRAAIQTAAKSH
jgi:DNA-binding GntR family transcriptional regulator